MKIYFWDLQTREIVQVLEGHRGGFNETSTVFNCLTSSFADVVIAVAVRATLIMYLYLC